MPLSIFKGSGGTSGTPVAFVTGRSVDTTVSIKIADPSSMTELDSLASSSTDVPRRVRLDKNRNYAFVVSSANSGNITAINIADPFNLSEESTLAGIRGYELVLDTTNNIAYSSDQLLNDIDIVDISNPSSMSSLGSFSCTAPRGLAIDIVGSVVFHAEGSTALGYDVRSVDVSNPASTSVLDTIEVDGTTGAGPLVLDATNDVVYVGFPGNNKIYSIDVSTPSSMSLLGSYTAPLFRESLSGLALDEVNQVLYKIGSDGIVAIDVSSPSSMSTLDSHDSSNFNVANDIALDLENSIAYVAMLGNDTLVAVDISNPASMSELGTFSSASTTELSSVAV